MNLSGLIVTAEPVHLASVIDEVARLPGVQVHQHDADTGRIVLVQEASDVDDEVRGCMRIRELPHVLNVDLVCHYFGDDPNAAPAAPAQPAAA